MRELNERPCGNDNMKSLADLGPYSEPLWERGTDEHGEVWTRSDRECDWKGTDWTGRDSILCKVGGLAVVTQVDKERRGRERTSASATS